MKLSNFGKKFTRTIGIGQLMDDLGRALSENSSMLMLGGGNPAHIPDVQAHFRRRIQIILEEPGEFERLIGNYDTPQGNTAFLDALAELLRHEFGWPVTRENIALTLGSQNSFFLLFNMFAGRMNGSRRKILFPLTPEYIGYADAGLEEDFFTAARPEIDLLDGKLFKYRVDFDALRLDDGIGAVCVSRPTNPTGNVLTNAEIDRLDALAREREIPLIVDNAYGTPFPNILYEPAHPVWNENTIVCMSLSKLGLPALRTGIVIASPDIVRAIGKMVAVLSLAPVSLGASLALDLVRSGEILEISRKIVRPFYETKARRALARIRSEMEGVDVRIHKPEGAIFLWLWFRDLPIDDRELYARLKRRGVLVVPGSYFFPGLDAPWRHKQECIRVTYAQDDAVVDQGLSIIASEVRAAYAR